MNELRRLAIPAVVLTGLLALDFVFRPIPLGFALRTWLVGLGVLAASALVRGSLAPYRQVQVERARFVRRRLRIPERPAGLAEAERAVDYAAWNPADLNRRLRPLLREVAAHRLLTRRGIDIERHPELARELLGNTAWDLIHLPAASRSKGDPGASPPAIRETIERLEEL